MPDFKIKSAEKEDTRTTKVSNTHSGKSRDSGNSLGQHRTEAAGPLPKVSTYSFLIVTNTPNL